MKLPDLPAARANARSAKRLGLVDGWKRVENAAPPIGFAYGIAKRAHKAVGQVRKYSGKPYIKHPIRVAKRVSAVFQSTDAVSAALLHDVVEDTNVSLDDLYAVDGLDPAVVRLVEMLTDVSQLKDGNRKFRKAMDRAHTAKASTKGKMVKLADLIDNTINIRARDPDFAKVYLREKRLLLSEALPPIAKPATELERAYMTLWNMATMMTRQ